MPNIDDQTFEQSFAEMAITQLQSKAPSLVNYVLGFQVVDRNEEGNRGMGFFGLKVGESWIYVPCFFLAGEIKGLEMMYVKSQDIFLPLADGWVNYVIQRKPMALGEVAGKDRAMQGVSAPDLRRLRVPPSEAKIACEKWASWAQGGVAMLARAAGVMSKLASDSLDLPRVLARANHTEGFVRQMREDPKLAQMVLRFYEPEDFLKAAAEVRETAPSEDSGNSRDWFKVFEGAKALEDPAITFLSDEEKTQLMRGNVVVRDARHEGAARKVYGVELTRTLTNPTEGGCYDVLRMDGTSGKAFVLIPNTVAQGGSQGLRLLLDPTNKAYAILPTTAIHTTHQYEWADCAKALENLGTSVKNQEFRVQDGFQRYLLVSGCQAYGPFTVHKRLENQDGTTTLMVECNPSIQSTRDKVDHESRSYQHMPFDSVLFDDAHHTNLMPNGGYAAHMGSSCSGFGAFDRIILSDKPLRRAIQSRGVLLVPRNGDFRVVELSDELKLEASPATTADMYVGVSKLASELRVWHDGVETRFEHQGKYASAQSPGEELAVLIHGLGLAEEPAREIAKTARETLRAVKRYWVEDREKRASFDHPDFAASYDQYFRAPVQQGGLSVTKLLPEHASFDQASAAQYQHFPDENLADYRKIYQEDISTMNQAAQTGQKDVFDASALGALINVGDVNEEIDSYNSDLIKALDKLGRTLFLLYWHSEDLTERYGKNAYRDLSDNVKSVFEKLGDTVLSLREKVPGNDEFTKLLSN